MGEPEHNPADDLTLLAQAVASHEAVMQRLLDEMLDLRILAEETAVRLRNLERKGAQK